MSRCPGPHLLSCGVCGGTDAGLLARAEVERLRDRLQTVVDEQVSPHETLPAEELITLLDHSLAEGRHELERLRQALAAERAHGEKELVAKDAEIARLRAELGYIANAKRFDREAFDSIEEFAAWAQSRARHALAEDET